MSHVHNSCLYKKVSLDKDGYVRNCPSMAEKYDLSDGLGKIIKTPAFRKYWNITKKKSKFVRIVSFDIIVLIAEHIQKTDYSVNPLHASIILL